MVECGCFDCILMSCQGQQHLAFFHIPNLGFPGLAEISAPCHHKLGVLAEGNRINPPLVSLECPQFPAIVRIPDLRGFVLASSDDQFAIRAK